MDFSLVNEIVQEVGTRLKNAEGKGPGVEVEVRWNER